MNTKTLIGYAAGKLTGSDDDGSLYSHLRDRLAKRGIHLYLPGEHTKPGERATHSMQGSEEIFALDVFRVGLADFMLCSLDKASTGTGMEIVIASDGLVPTFSFYRHDLQLEKDVSRMPVGNPGNLRFGTTGSIQVLPSVDKIIYYRDPEHLTDEVLRQIDACRVVFECAREVKRKLDGAWKELELSRLLAQRQAEKALTDEQVAVRLGTTQEVVTRLKMTQAEFEDFFRKHVHDLFGKGKFELVIEPSEVSVLRYLNPSVVQLSSLSAVLEVNLFHVIGHSLERAFGSQFRRASVSTDGLPEDLRRSLDSLLSLADRTKPAMIEFLYHREIGRYHELALTKAAQYTTRDINYWKAEIEQVRQRTLS